METRRSKAGRRRAPHLVAALLAPAIVGGCEDMLVAGPPQELGNVRVEVGVTVAESDSGITVNGRPVVDHPPMDRALWLDRFERFDLGGYPELGYPQDSRHSVSWRVMLTHARPPEQRGDSTILRYHDHGDALLGGLPMEKLTDLPDLGPGAPPVRFENFVRYLLATSVEVEWMHGGITRFVDLPIHGELATGGAVTVETTGSEAALPVHSAFAAHRPLRLTTVENDGELDLKTGGVPVIDVDHPLVFAFDTAMDPDQSFIIVHPLFVHAQPGARAAVIQLRFATRRVVIPPHILRELVAQAAPRTAYRATIVEVKVRPDVFAGTLAAPGDDPEDFALPFVQRGETSVHLFLEKR